MGGRISYYGNIVRDGLVLHLDAGKVDSYPKTGSLWRDLSGNNNNGTLTNFGSQTIWNGDNGGSIVFDGIDDYVSFVSSINVGQNFSIFSWIYPGTINIRNAIFGNAYPYQPNTGWLLATATGYAGLTNTFFISIGQDQSVRVTSNNTLTLNSWNFIGATVSNGGELIKLYRNGLETSYTPTTTTSVSISYSSNECYIARRYSTTPEVFPGRISSTMLYNRTLSDSEVLQNYNALKGRYNL